MRRIILLVLILSLYIGCAQKPPTITKVDPSIAPTIGGTEITITGTGFKASPAITVTIGGNPATGLKVISKTSLKATVPHGIAGPADIVVTKAKVKSLPYKGFIYKEVIHNNNNIKITVSGSYNYIRVNVKSDQSGEPVTIALVVGGALVGDDKQYTWQIFIESDSPRKLLPGKELVFENEVQIDPNAICKVIIGIEEYDNPPYAIYWEGKVNTPGKSMILGMSEMKSLIKALIEKGKKMDRRGSVVVSGRPTNRPDYDIRMSVSTSLGNICATVMLGQEAKPVTILISFIGDETNIFGSTSSPKKLLPGKSINLVDLQEHKTNMDVVYRIELVIEEDNGYRFILQWKGRLNTPGELEIQEMPKMKS